METIEEKSEELAISATVGVMEFIETEMGEKFPSDYDRINIEVECYQNIAKLLEELYQEIKQYQFRSGK